MRKVKKIFRKILSFFKTIANKIHFKKKKNRKKENVKILQNNVCYVDWIDSIERQILQNKIDYALGWIDSLVYEQKMEEFRLKIKDISESYIEYMRINKISIPKELAVKYC